MFNAKTLLPDIITEHSEINKELKQINLTIDKLTTTALNALLSKLNCTNYNTRGGAGFIQWDAMVRNIRELCCGEHWDKYENNGVEGIISKDKKIKLIPSSGNAATANPKQPPSNKNPKGYRTMELVNNSIQTNLFHIFPDHIEDFESEVYVLLYYNNTKELRLELSIPSYIDKKGYIKAWQKRIILPPIKLNEVEIKTLTSPTLPKIEEIDIPIKRKT